jgi:nucleoside-diphosphate-sugar epimerase
MNPALGRVFITGVTGCIGSALTARLSREGIHVVALVRDPGRAAYLRNLPGVEIIAADLFARDAISQAMRDCDAVFHLAARVHTGEREANESPEEFTRINVEGARSILEAAIENQIASFVFFSTVAVYPESDDELDEETPPAPLTPYGQSKLAAERLVLSRAAECGMHAVVLRPTVVYGPRDRGNVSRLIEAIRRGRFFIIGDGANRKSMVAVENVVDAALLVAGNEKSRNQIYNVCDSRAYTLSEIAATIAAALGRSPQFIHVPFGVALLMGKVADVISRASGLTLPLSADRVRKLAGNTRYSARKIERELGFRPGVELRQRVSILVGETLKVGGFPE